MSVLTKKVMFFFMLLVVSLAMQACSSDQNVSGDPGRSSAEGVARGVQLVGKLEGLSGSSAASARAVAGSSQDSCPDVSLKIYPAGPVDLQFDENCELFVTDLPLGTVMVEVQVNGITGAITLDNLVEGELVEMEIRGGINGLQINVQRWPNHATLSFPAIVNEDGLTINLPKGSYAQTLTVNGDNVKLNGVGCTGNDEESTIIEGAVVINGSQASINGVKFLSPVTVRGSNVSLQGCCFEKGVFFVGAGASQRDSQEVSDCEELVDFEGLAVGSSVEGPGKVHPDLEISTRHAGQQGAVVIGEGESPALYTGPEGQSEQVSNGCLGNPGQYEIEGSRYGRGFGDLDKVNDYEFTILNGKSVGYFEITMLDFGDFNPEKTKLHSVELVAYCYRNGQRVILDRDDSFSYSSPEDEWPTTSFDPAKGNLQRTGDACTARPGDPGNYTFHVSGPGITNVELLIKTGPDPEIAFDNIKFRLEQIEAQIDVIPNINLKSQGVTPVVIFGGPCLDVKDIDPATVRLGSGGAHAKGSLWTMMTKNHDDNDDNDDDQGFVRDYNGDHFLDLILHFPTQDIGLTAYDKEVCLTGSTFGGTMFQGCGAIRIVPGSSKPEKGR